MKDFASDKSAHNLPLQQHPNYAAMLTLLGREAREITLPHDGHALVQSRVFGPFGRVNMVSRGPTLKSTSDDNILDAIEYLREDNVQIINPAFPMDDLLRAAGYRQIMTPAHRAVLDLKQSDQERTAGMHGKWRNRFRSAERQNLTTKIQPFIVDNHRWLLAAEAEQQRQRGYRGWPVALTAAFAKANPSAAWLATAKSGRDTIAAMLFLAHRPAMSYHIGWISEVGRRLHAHNLLLVQAAKYFSERAFIELDLGLIETELTPGLARFKLGIGATIDPLGGTWLHLPGMRRITL
jgi:hypothetical protein